MEIAALTRVAMAEVSVVVTNFGLTWLTIRDSEWMQVADLRFCAATCRKVCTKSGPRSALSGALGGRVASATRAFPDQRNSGDYETDWCTPQFKWCDRPPDPQLQARSPSPPCACDDLGRFTTGVNTKLSQVGSYGDRSSPGSPWLRSRSLSPTSASGARPLPYIMIITLVAVASMRLSKRTWSASRVFV
jgi:hypothetical protein